MLFKQSQITSPLFSKASNGFPSHSALKKNKNQSSYNWPPKPFVILLLVFSLAISPAPQINILPYCSNKWNLALRTLAVALSTQIRLLLPQPCDGSFCLFLPSDLGSTVRFERSVLTVLYKTATHHPWCSLSLYYIPHLLSCFFYKLIFLRVKLLYSVVLLSTAQQSELATRVGKSRPFWTSSRLGQHSALSRVPWATQYVLISYIFCIQYQ